VDENEGDRAESEAEDHDRNGQEEDAAAADAINVMECDESEGKVCHGDAKGSEGRRFEADECEDGGGEIHEGVLRKLA